MAHYFTNDNIEHNRKIIKVKIKNQDFQFITDNGVFSKNGMDFGTRTLLENLNYQKMTTAQKIDAMLQRSKSRQYFYELIIKLVGVCLDRGFRIIIENPYSPLHYLCNNFFKAPDVFDRNRQRRGDFFNKPTGYWYFNCGPTIGYSYQNPKEKRTIFSCRGAKEAGLCSEERSLISPDYARNFICDFILGKPQPDICSTLFDAM